MTNSTDEIRRQRVQRVLVFRIGSLGDTVAALPSFHLIASAFPDAQRTLLADVHAYSNGTAAKAVLDGSGLIHEYMTYPGATRDAMALVKLFVAIRRLKPDVLVYLMPPRPQASVARDRWFFRLAGIKWIVGLPGEEESINRFDPSTGLYETETDRLARCIRELGDAESDELASWDLNLSDAELREADELLHPVGSSPMFVCASGCKMQANDWGVTNWKQLFQELYLRHPDAALVMVGGGNEVERCDEIASAWKGKTLNLAGKSNPRVTAAIIRHAMLFLGLNSGPKHLAASVGAPSVCIFSGRDLPGVWFPPAERCTVVYHRTACEGCMLETCLEQRRKCLLSITVAEVLQAVDSMMRKKVCA